MASAPFHVSSSQQTLVNLSTVIAFNDMGQAQKILLDPQNQLTPAQKEKVNALFRQYHFPFIPDHQRSDLATRIRSIEAELEQKSDVVMSVASPFQAAGSNQTIQRISDLILAGDIQGAKKLFLEHDQFTPQQKEGIREILFFLCQAYRPNLTEYATSVNWWKTSTPQEIAQLKEQIRQIEHLDIDKLPLLTTLMRSGQFNPEDFDFSNLRTMTLPRFGMNDRLLQRFATRLSQNAPHFHHLIYSFSKELTDERLLNFVRHCRTLKEITLSEYALSGKSLSELPHVERVNWRETNSRPPLYAISRIPNLQHLKIGFNRLDGYLDRLGGAQLDTLDLSQNTFHPPEVILGLNACPSLRKLTLANCEGHFSDMTFSQLRLPNLEQLDLSNVYFEVNPDKEHFSLTLIGLYSFIQNCPKLKAIVLTDDSFGLPKADIQRLKTECPHIQFLSDSRQLPALPPRPPIARVIADPQLKDTYPDVARIYPPYPNPVQHN